MPTENLAWPHNKPLTDDRPTYNTARYLTCYRNGGMRKLDDSTFIALSNRQSRRAQGRYTRDYDTSTRSRKASPWNDTPRTSVIARRLRRNPLVSVTS